MRGIKAAIFLYIILGILVFFSKEVLADDTTPPEITELEILDISTSTVVIQWKTNENADSVVNYGLNKNYGIARDSVYAKAHQLIITDLAPGTTHYFQVASSDPSGNQGISRGYQFITKSTKSSVGQIEGIETISSETERALTERAVETIGRITMPEALAVIAYQL
jgi:hypothetical protein